MNSFKSNVVEWFSVNNVTAQWKSWDSIGSSMCCFHFSRAACCTTIPVNWLKVTAYNSTPTRIDTRTWPLVCTTQRRIHHRSAFATQLSIIIRTGRTPHPCINIPHMTPTAIHTINARDKLTRGLCEYQTLLRIPVRTRTSQGYLAQKPHILHIRRSTGTSFLPWFCTCNHL